MAEQPAYPEILRVVSYKGALPALATLKAGELNMGQFCVAAGLTDQPARTLRLAFQEAGLVEVTERKVRGAIEIRLRLTARGERAAKLVLDLVRVLTTR